MAIFTFPNYHVFKFSNSTHFQIINFPFAPSLGIQGD